MTSLPSLGAKLGGLLPKVAVFLVATLVGGSVAYVGAAALNRSGPISTLADLPEFQAAADTTDPPLAFDLISSAGAPAVVVPGLPDATLASTAEAVLDSGPPSWINTSGFPRIDPISQFDGGPFQNANCTLAAGAMLARLGYGIVTTGSILRELQTDKVGGTGLDDLAVALWKGYGATFHSGTILPAHLRQLSEVGHGIVIQGIYGKFPAKYRLQDDFLDPHAIYIDGYVPGPGGSPGAYWVIDPLGLPQLGYEGELIPAQFVESFGAAFTSTGRIAAAWVFPPGGVPPDTSGIQIEPLSPSGGEGPGPSGSAPPGPEEPGDDEPAPPELINPPLVATIGGYDLIPWLLICLQEPPPVGCPPGVPGTLIDVAITDAILGASPAIDVGFVDSDRPNIALVGFTVDPPTSATVEFWRADFSPGVIETASSIASVDVLGEQSMVATLDVVASTEYHFRVVAGEGGQAAVSPIGTFTTGDGVVLFEVALAAVATPVFELSTDPSPYLHLAPGGLAAPMRADDGSCAAPVEFGLDTFCTDPAPAPAGGPCSVATVTYKLEGIETGGVLIRAFPPNGRDPNGLTFVQGIIEADGPAGEGAVQIGCLTPGLAYDVVVDAIGDNGGPLAHEVIEAP